MLSEAKHRSLNEQLSRSNGLCGRVMLSEAKHLRLPYKR
jgi:hypothetical protein